MSRRALREFAENSLRNQSLCPQIARDNLSEDWNVPYCLAKLNVMAGDGRDPMSRERFFIYPPQRHLLNETGTRYWHRKYYENNEGLNGCSNYTISFHYVYSRNMYTMYFLAYHLKPYGIQHRYPPIPKKRDFTEVKRILEMDRINKYRRRTWQ